MKKIVLITSFLMFSTQLANAQATLPPLEEGFAYAQELVQKLPIHEIRAYTKDIRRLFHVGNVVGFNRLRAVHPMLPVDLRNVRCKGRSLKQIDLRNTILKGSDFRGCDLEGAKFQNSYLVDVNFQSFAGHGETNLFGANFTGAIVQYSNSIEYSITHFLGRLDQSPGNVPNFRNTDLSNTIGIDESIVDSRGSNAMALANSNEIFTGKYDFFSNLFQSAQSELMAILPNNPFIKNLSAETQQLLVGKNAWVVFGRYYGSSSFDIINTDPNVVIILNGFSSHGYVKSVSDIIICGVSGMGEIQSLKALFISVKKKTTTKEKKTTTIGN